MLIRHGFGTIGERLGNRGNKRENKMIKNSDLNYWFGIAMFAAIGCITMLIWLNCPGESECVRSALGLPRMFNMSQHYLIGSGYSSMILITSLMSIGMLIFSLILKKESRTPLMLLLVNGACMMTISLFLLSVFILNITGTNVIIFIENRGIFMMIGKVGIATFLTGFLMMLRYHHHYHGKDTGHKADSSPQPAEA